MPTEPVTLFAPRLDFEAALAAARAVAPDVVADGPAQRWSDLRLSVRRGVLRRAHTLILSHDPDYEADPNWTTQMRGMTNFLSTWPRNDNTKPVLSLITALRHCLGVVAEPTLDFDADSDDVRLRTVLAVARQLDAILFTPSSVRDSNGRILLSIDGDDVDPRAVVPSVPAVHRDAETGVVSVRMPADVAYRAPGPNTEEIADDEEVPPPPSADRVAARTLALGAVTGRALLEQEDPADAGVEETRLRILAWVDKIGIGDELEPDELQLLRHSIGEPDRQSTLNATWRLEGLGVLAWALHRFELQPIDSLVNPGNLLPAVGILNVDQARELLARPPLRSATELRQLRDRLFAVHWRLVNFRVKPEAMDFVAFAKTAWFGPLDLSGVRLIDGDLAIGDAPIARADRQLLGSAMSAATERHLAINWLCGGSEIYSDTDVST